MDSNDGSASQENLFCSDPMDREKFPWILDGVIVCSTIEERVPITMTLLVGVKPANMISPILGVRFLHRTEPRHARCPPRT
jgi:hypothetical protein